MASRGAQLRDVAARSPEEWAVRRDLAAIYRLVAHFGWDDLIYTHISARVPGSEEHLLINPFGLMFDEITASSLIKVNSDGMPVEESPWEVKRAGITIHTAVHHGRPDAGCVVHLHTIDGVAVSAMADGLMPINQAAIALSASLAYHDYEGPAFRDDERDRLIASIGTANHVLLRNHGTLAVGPSVAQAFMSIYTLERACSTQVRSLAGGRALYPVSAEALAETRHIAGKFASSDQAGKRVWPAMLRMLDRQGSNHAD